MSRQVFWAIKRKDDFYVGTALRRVDMIVEHVNAIYFAAPYQSFARSALTKEQKAKWRECQRRGDRAVKVELVEIP